MSAGVKDGGFGGERVEGLQVRQTVGFDELGLEPVEGSRRGATETGLLARRAIQKNGPSSHETAATSLLRGGNHIGAVGGDAIEHCGAAEGQGLGDIGRLSCAKASKKELKKLRIGRVLGKLKSALR